MTFRGHKREVQHIGLDFSKGARMFTAGFDKIMKMWDVSSGECLKTFEQEHTDGIAHIVVSKYGQHVYTGSKDFTIKKWHIESGKVIKNIRMKCGQIWSFILSRTEDHLFAGCYGANVDMYDIENASKVKCIGTHSDGVRSLALAEHDTILYSGSSDSSISKWSINGISPDDAPMKLKQFKGHTKQINTIVLNSTDTLLASGSYDNSVRIWNIQEETDDEIVHECAHKFLGHSAAVWQVLFSKDDKFLFSAADCVKIWSISKKQCVASFGGQLSEKNMELGCIALSPDGSRVFSGGKDGIVKKWYLSASNIDEKKKNDSKTTNERQNIQFN